MKISVVLIFMLSVLACKKNCTNAGQYIVPTSIMITSGKSFKVNKDSIFVKISIPFRTNDVRDQAPIDILFYPQSHIFISLSHRPTLRSDVNVINIDLFGEGYFERITQKGKSLRSSMLMYEYERGQSAWEISFVLIPKKYLDGVISLHFGPTQFRNDCLLIQPNYEFYNSTQNWDLLSSQLTYSAGPWSNDYYFYLVP
jgi:hypothetical protein